MAKILITEEQLRNIIKEDFSDYETNDLEKRYASAYRLRDEDMALDIIKEYAAIKMPYTWVTDKFGKPLIVHHFTKSDKFNVFDHEHGSGRNGVVLGNRFYFTPSTEDEYNIGGTRRDFFINIEHPYYADRPVPQKILDNEELMSRLFGDNWMKHPYIMEKLHAKKLGLVDLEGCFKRRFIDEMGFDGVIYGGGWFDNAQYAVNKPSQIKSAEPFTFDDHGNIIPLSKRFDFNNNDIRY